MAFLFVFVGLYKSISVRILYDLIQNTDLKLDYNITLNEYLIEESYKKRIDILLKRKMVFVRNGKFLLTDKGKKYIAVYAKVQKVFSINQSG